MTAVRLPNSQNREWDGAYCSSVLAQHAPSLQTLQKKIMIEAQIEHRPIRLGVFSILSLDLSLAFR